MNAGVLVAKTFSRQAVPGCIHAQWSSHQLELGPADMGLSTLQSLGRADVAAFLPTLRYEDIVDLLREHVRLLNVGYESLEEMPILVVIHPRIDPDPLLKVFIPRLVNASSPGFLVTAYSSMDYLDNIINAVVGFEPEPTALWFDRTIDSAHCPCLCWRAWLVRALHWAEAYQVGESASKARAALEAFTRNDAALADALRRVTKLWKS